MIVETNYI